MLDFAFIGTGVVLMLAGGVILGYVCKAEKIWWVLFAITMIFFAGFFFGAAPSNSPFRINSPTVSVAPSN